MILWFSGTVLDLDHQKGARKEAEVGVRIKASRQAKRNTVISNYCTVEVHLAFKTSNFPQL